MKKIFPIALIFALAGCAGGNNSTQILTQSVEEEVMPVTDVKASNMAENQETMAASKPKPAPRPVVVNTPKPKPVKPVAKVAKAPKPVTKPQVTKGQKYTIQVIALSHNKGFAEYMNRLPSDKPVWSNKKMVDGLPWYTLLYGEFNSKASAESALQALPNNIKQFGPFIRSFSSIKSSSSPEMTKLN